MAATLIQENETIILDSGSTTMEIAKNLHSFKQLTIITNAIDIAIELSKYKRFNVILLGGHLRDSSLYGRSHSREHAQNILLRQIISGCGQF